MARDKALVRRIGRLVRQVVDCLERPEGDARELERHVAALKAADWQGDGPDAARSWEQFCRERLGCEAADLQEILEGAASLQELGLLNPSVAQAREALRFELDPKAQTPPVAEPPPPGAPPPLVRMQRDWLELTEQERDQFLAWASAGQLKPKRRRGRPRKYP